MPVISLGALLTAVVICGALTVGCSTQESSPPPQPQTAVDPSTIGSVAGQVLAPPAGAIVTLTARDGRQLPPQRVKPFMDQEQTTFVPDALIARAGFPMAFYNSDGELHNINVRNPQRTAAELNRSIPPGGSFDHVFAEPGFYHVRCDIHIAMYAEIFVASTPFARWLGPEGTFHFENVPVGGYTLTVHNGASLLLKQPVDVASGTNEVRVGS